MRFSLVHTQPRIPVFLCFSQNEGDRKSFILKNQRIPCFPKVSKEPGKEVFKSIGNRLFLIALDKVVEIQED